MPSTTSLKRALRALLALAFWLAVWMAAVWRLQQQGMAQALILPDPLTVVRRLGELAATAPFWQTVALSLGRVLLGLVWGAALGAVLAALSCASQWLDAVIAPAVRVIRATPVASFILLVLLWTRRETVPVVIAALMVLPVMWGNVAQGIRQTDPKLLELARAYRFSRAKTARLVVLPSVRPYVLSALTTSLGLAWKAGVAAEALCLPEVAIGTRIYTTKYYLETPDLFAWTLTVIVLSMALEWALTALVRRLERGQGG